MLVKKAKQEDSKLLLRLPSPWLDLLPERETTARNDNPFRIKPKSKQGKRQGHQVDHRVDVEYEIGRELEHFKVEACCRQQENPWKPHETTQ